MGKYGLWRGVVVCFSRLFGWNSNSLQRQSCVFVRDTDNGIPTTTTLMVSGGLDGAACWWIEPSGPFNLFLHSPLASCCVCVWVFVCVGAVRLCMGWCHMRVRVCSVYCPQSGDPTPPWTDPTDLTGPSTKPKPNPCPGHHPPVPRASPGVFPPKSSWVACASSVPIPPLHRWSGCSC